MTDKIQEIIDFWFEGVTDDIVIDKRALPFRKWFALNPKFDEEIRRRFGQDLAAAAEGKYSEWQKTARGRLALILLFDQFSRNIYRNSPRAYAFDPLALSLATQSVEEKTDKNLLVIQRVFMYMPFMHAEDVKIQELSVKCFETLIEEARQKNPANVPYYEYHLSYAQGHASTIRRFGRFPRRNAILGRETTIEEKKFLKT